MPVEESVLARDRFHWIFEASGRKLIHQRFREAVNAIATFQCAVFAEQHDLLSIVMFQVTLLAPPKMLSEHLGSGTRRHGRNTRAVVRLVVLLAKARRMN